MFPVNVLRLAAKPLFVNLTKPTPKGNVVQGKKCLSVAAAGRKIKPLILAWHWKLLQLNFQVDTFYLPSASCAHYSLLVTQVSWNTS